MESINLEELERFTGGPVEIAIRDLVGGDQAPIVNKAIKKVKLCPDGTHIRFYFDDYYFLAVPLASDVIETKTEWLAFDSESGLHYIVKKVQVEY